MVPKISPELAARIVSSLESSGFTQYPKAGSRECLLYKEVIALAGGRPAGERPRLVQYEIALRSLLSPYLEIDGGVWNSKKHIIPYLRSIVAGGSKAAAPARGRGFWLYMDVMGGEDYHRWVCSDFLPQQGSTIVIPELGKEGEVMEHLEAEVELIEYVLNKSGECDVVVITSYNYGAGWADDNRRQAIASGWHRGHPMDTSKAATHAS